MTTCSWWRRHQWGKWQTVQTFDIVRVNSKSLLGKVLIQQRVCARCGYVQIDEQRFETS